MAKPVARMAEGVGMSQQDQVAERASSPRRAFAMTIVAQDPSVGDDRGMLRATVPVPADRLEPGPRSHRFQVIDYDATARVLLPPATLAAGDGAQESDPFDGRPDEELLSDPRSTRRTCTRSPPGPWRRSSWPSAGA